MARLGGLGKGLGALIPSARSADGDRPSDAARLDELPIESIRAEPRISRGCTSTRSRSRELAASIREIGVLQPVLVRPVDGRRSSCSPASGAGGPHAGPASP